MCVTQGRRAPPVDARPLEHIAGGPYGRVVGNALFLYFMTKTHNIITFKKRLLTMRELSRANGVP